ncbi:phage tail protein [Paracidovorax citrulli]|uniref:phage tail protein n=1 Tax=Paracidovorax citrulli TaxID=80869 RepID=UPI0005FB8AED|nr:phage tail protein [Paracidovorax citrulli]
MAQLVLGTVGAVVGGLIGGPMGASVGWAIGGAVGGMLNPQKVEGPRLTDLKVTASEYGAPIPVVYAHPRISGTVIWCSEKREIASTETQGKGGGPEYTSYTYEIDLLYLLSDNEIEGVRRIWSNGKLVWSMAHESDDETIEASEDTPTWRALRLHTGAPGQLPDPTYEAAVGAGNAPAYIGRGTLMLEGVSLGSSGQLPNLTFEVGQRADAQEQERFFHAPFDDGDARDVEPNPLSSDVASPGLVTFSGGAAVFRNSYPVNDSPSAARIRWTGEKIAPIVAGSVFELQARISIDSVRAEGLSRYPDQELFFGIYGFGVAAWWGITIKDGEPLLVTSVQANATGQSAILGSPVGADVPYRIVIGATASGSVQFFLGEDEVFSGTVYAPSLNSITVGIQGQPFPDQSVSGLTCYDVQGLLGMGGSRVRLYPVPLDEVVSDLCQRCGVPASDIDVTQLEDQEVHAMAVQPTSARAVLEQLAAAYYFECVESDKLYFRRRGAPAVAAVPYSDMGADALLTVQEGNDLEVPARVNVTYLNLANAYQQGNELSDRLTTDSTTVSNLQLGMGLTPSMAKAIADTAVLDQTVAARTYSAGLDLRYARLEPTDVVALSDSSGIEHRARIVKIADADGVRSLDLVADDAGVLQLQGETSTDYDDDWTVQPLGETDLAVLDIPMLRDADDNPGVYTAGDGKRGAWPGYLLRVSGVDVGTMASGAAMGFVQEVLGGWQGGLIDEQHTITVVLNPGDQLASTTHDALTSGIVNHAAIGAHGRWEIVQFRSAALLSANTYRVSGLVRGRLGTEHAMGNHQLGDRFVLLTGDGMQRWIGNAAQRGEEQDFEGITLGAKADSATTVPLAPDWESLKPYAPASLRIVPTEAGLMLQWDRRTRMVANWLAGNVPLGEAQERYEVEIEAAGGAVTVVQTAEPQLLLTGSSDFRSEGVLAGPIGQFVHEARVDGGALMALETSVYGTGGAPAGNSRIVRMDPVTFDREDLAYAGVYASALVRVGEHYYTVDVGAGDGMPGRVRKFDPGLTLLADVALDLPGDGFDMILGPDGNLWVAAPYSGVVRVINPETLATVGDVPVGFVSAICADGTSVFAVVRVSEVAKRIDAATRAVVAEWPIARFPMDCKFAGGLLWVVSAYDRNLTCYEPSTGVRQEFAVAMDGETFQGYFNYLGQSGDYIVAGQRVAWVIHAPTRTLVGRIQPFTDLSRFPAISMLSEDRVLVSEGPSRPAPGGIGYWSRGNLGSFARARVYQLSATVGRGRPAEIEA